MDKQTSSKRNLKQISTFKGGVSNTDWLKTFGKAIRAAAKASPSLRKTDGLSYLPTLMKVSAVIFLTHPTY